MRIQEHISLKELTTMKIGGTARYFVSVASVPELEEALAFAREKNIPFTILGGGSNVLISGGEINRLFIKIEIKGIEWDEHGTEAERSQHGSDTELVIAGAGEWWDSLVAAAVEKGLWGIENLSGIPGTVGAAPVQNIGAYGSELADVLKWVEVLDAVSGETRQLSSKECFFEYRDSIFKIPEGKGLIITRVALRLSKNGEPNLEYKDLQERFKIKDLRFKKEEPTLSDIRRAVLEIRSRKFPDLAVYGTAGSFFKNPIIPKRQFDELKKKYPDLPGFEIHGTGRNEANTEATRNIKVPLAWILDNICNIKGETRGNVGSFKNQPIVLVNFGGASAEEVVAFAKQVIDCVKERTGIDVEYEVQKIN